MRWSARSTTPSTWSPSPSRTARYVIGGGASAAEIAMHLRDEAAKVGGREQLAFECFAEALDSIPRTLAENAGLDPIDILIELRKSHKAGKRNAGVDISAGKVGDMLTLHVIEPIRVGRQAIESATDAAVMILRIDDVIASKSSPPPSGGPGGPGGMGGMGGMGGGDFGDD